MFGRSKHGFTATTVLRIGAIVAGAAGIVNPKPLYSQGLSVFFLLINELARRLAALWERQGWAVRARPLRIDLSRFTVSTLVPLDTDAFEAALAQWTRQWLAATGERVAIAVDGKALRGIHTARRAAGGGLCPWRRPGSGAKGGSGQVRGS